MGAQEIFGNKGKVAGTVPITTISSRILEFRVTEMADKLSFEFSRFFKATLFSGSDV